MDLYHVILYTVSERGQGVASDDTSPFCLQKKHSPQRNCHCHWHVLVMNSMDTQYSMLTWLILFSYLSLLALPFGIRVQLQFM